MDAVTRSQQTTIDNAGHDRAAVVLDQLPRAVASFDLPADGAPRLVTANLALAKMFRATADDLRADTQRFWDRIEDGDREALAEWFATPTEHVEEICVRLHADAGRPIVAGILLSCRVDDDGRATQADLLIEDRRRADDLEEQVADREVALRRLAQRTSEAVFHLRLWPRIGVVWANDATAELLGVARDNLLARPATFFDAIHQEDLTVLERAMQRAVGTTTRLRCRLAPKSGPSSTTAPALVDIELSPVRSDGGEGVILLGMASRCASPDLSVLVSSSDVDRQAPGRPRERSTEAGALVRRLVEASALAGDQIVVRAEATDHVIDADSLAPAVEAILANVRRHTPQDTRVEVTVARASNGVLIAVRDDGPGMRWPGGCAVGRYGMAEVGSLVDHGGNGLAAIQRAAQRHGGRATIQSSPGQGTTVRLLLHAVVSEPLGVARPLMMG